MNGRSTTCYRRRFRHDFDIADRDRKLAVVARLVVGWPGAPGSASANFQLELPARSRIYQRRNGQAQIQPRVTKEHKRRQWFAIQEHVELQRMSAKIRQVRR